MEKNKLHRLSIAIDSNIKDSITTLAAINKSSVNGLINEILKKYVEANNEVLTKYNDFIDNLTDVKSDAVVFGDLFEENK